MVTEEKLMLGLITDTPTRQRAESRDDLYLLVSHTIRNVAWNTVFTFPATRPKTQLQTIIDELDDLSRRPNNIPGYAFRPSKHAIHSAKFYIYETYAKMLDAFPRPSFVLDGEEGIIIKWTHNGHAVRLNCMGTFGEQDYIYYENGEYDVEDNLTPDVLKNRLNWLMQKNERESAR